MLSVASCENQSSSNVPKYFHSPRCRPPTCDRRGLRGGNEREMPQTTYWAKSFPGGQSRRLPRRRQLGCARHVPVFQHGRPDWPDFSSAGAPALLKLRDSSLPRSSCARCRPVLEESLHLRKERSSRLPLLALPPRQRTLVHAQPLSRCLLRHLQGGPEPDEPFAPALRCGSGSYHRKSMIAGMYRISGAEAIAFQLRTLVLSTPSSSATSFCNIFRPRRLSGCGHPKCSTAPGFGSLGLVPFG